MNQVTGIQRVMMDIQTALKPAFDSKIVGTVEWKDVSKDLGIAEDDYICKKDWGVFRNSVVIFHERRFMPLFRLLNILGWNMRLVYVHHSLLYGKRFLSFFPPTVVAIADKGIENLTRYFKVPFSRITKIHNCVREQGATPYRSKPYDLSNIRILYPSRIDSNKRQTEIVGRLKGNLSPNVKISFVGDGEMAEELRELCKDSEQFEYLGYRNDVIELMEDSDFVMLFSGHEGLPITLIEAMMTGTPAICNSVGGNPEIVSDGDNGFIAEDWDSLLNTLNSLPELPSERVAELGREARDTYKRKFSFAPFRDAYIKLISPLANS